MNDDYTSNSHHLTYTSILKGWENVLFELRSERVCNIAIEQGPCKEMWLPFVSKDGAASLFTLCQKAQHVEKLHQRVVWCHVG